MIIRFEVDCFGYSVGGYKNSFEIEIEEYEIEDMSEKQRDIYISEQIENYIRDNIEFSFEI